jgi:hypothetical protein
MIGVLLRLLYGVHSTDMGPFPAIRRDTLDKLNLREETYGWPLEMQMRAARASAHNGGTCRLPTASGRSFKNRGNNSRNDIGVDAHSHNIRTHRDTKALKDLKSDAHSTKAVLEDNDVLVTLRHPICVPPPQSSMPGQ